MDYNVNEKVLASYTNSKNNNFDALRLIAALLVLFSHSFSFLALEQPQFPFHNGTYDNSVGLFAVNVFFIISGFLITRSFLIRNNPAKFMWSRVLRIFPALICVVIITVFLIGPILTELPLGEYFGNLQTYRYLTNITLFDFNRYLPSTHGDLDINIALWTLEYEFLFYLVVLFLGVTGVLKNRKIVFGMFLLSIVLTYFRFGEFWEIHTINILKMVWLFSYFSAGMVAYLYRDKIIIDTKIFLFVIFLLIIGSFESGYNDAFLVFLVTYVVLFLSYTPRLKIAWLAKFGDFSYGIYIWSSPVLILFIHQCGTGIDPYLLFIMAGCSVYIIGALSWILVEKRILGLKERFTAKDLPQW